MPTTPWIVRQSSSGPTAVAMLTYLPLSKYRYSLRFAGYVRQIYDQLQRTDGLIGFSMRAQPMRKQYWTLSLWRDEAAMMAFVHTRPHLDIMKLMHGRMAQTAFRSWTVTTPDQSLDWSEALSGELKAY